MKELAPKHIDDDLEDEEEEANNDGKVMESTVIFTSADAAAKSQVQSTADVSHIVKNSEYDFDVKFHPITDDAPAKTKAHLVKNDTVDFDVNFHTIGNGGHEEVKDPFPIPSLEEMKKISEIRLPKKENIFSKLLDPSSTKDVGICVTVEYSTTSSCSSCR